MLWTAYVADRQSQTLQVHALGYLPSGRSGRFRWGAFIGTMLAAGRPIRKPTDRKTPRRRRRFPLNSPLRIVHPHDALGLCSSACAFSDEGAEEA